MTLVKLENFYPDSREYSFELDDLKSFTIYAEGDDKVGTVSDILVDEQTGQFRYLVVDSGFWIFGKKVLLPIAYPDIHYTEKRIYAKV